MTNTACALGEGICGICKDVDTLYNQTGEQIESMDRLVLESMFNVGFCRISFRKPNGRDNGRWWIRNCICRSHFSFLEFFHCFYYDKGYTFIQAMADGAVKMGLPRNVATKFAAQTLAVSFPHLVRFLQIFPKGSAAMVLKSGEHPIELRDRVCSPAGTTIDGVHALEKAAFSSAVIDAVEASTMKSKKLSMPKWNNLVDPRL